MPTARKESRQLTGHFCPGGVNRSADRELRKTGRITANNKPKDSIQGCLRWVKHTRFPYIIQLCCQTLPTSYLAPIQLTVGGATEASDAYSKCLRYEVVPSILYYLLITLPIYMYNELFPMKRIESFSLKGLACLQYYIY
jgi:hypothetical protein